MNDQEMQKAVMQAVDKRLSGLKDDPFLAQRIIASEKGKETMKKRKLSLSPVLALVLILGILTAAFAAEYLRREVNWLGETIPDESVSNAMPGPTLAPRPVEGMLDAETVFELIQKVMETVGEREVILVQEEHPNGTVSGSHNTMTVHVSSWAELEELLREADELPLPSFIPEQYEFVEAQVYYDCRADGEFVLHGTEELAQGVTAYRYHVADEDALIRGYSAVWRDSPEDYHYLSVYVSLYQQSDIHEYSFGVNEGDEVAVVNVSGYENALCITDEHQRWLTMRRALQTPVEHQLLSLQGAYVDEPYREVQVDLTAQLNTETLIAMFAE